MGDVKVLGKTRKRRNNARVALRLVKETLPHLHSLQAFNAAYTTAADRNTAQIAILEAHGQILLHIMKELKEDDDED